MPSWDDSRVNRCTASSAAVVLGSRRTGRDLAELTAPAAADAEPARGGDHSNPDPLALVPHIRSRKHGRVLSLLVALSLLLAAPASAESGELAYAESTSSTSITGTSTPDVVVTAPSITLDGSTRIMVEFFSNGALGGNSYLTIFLFQDGVQLTQLAYLDLSSVEYAPVFVARRFLPSSGSHVYSIRASVDAGSGQIRAGDGSPVAPAYIRITRAQPVYSTPADLAAVDANGCGGLGNPCQIEAAGSTAERLDLQWWGTWAMVGLLFALMLAPRWFSAFRVTRGG